MAEGGVYRFRNTDVWYHCILIADEYFYLKELTGNFDTVYKYYNCEEREQDFIKVGQR